MKLSRLRPSAAMIVAFVALIAAIGGTAYAASKINGNDIKRNTVTGKQVNESTLKTVKRIEDQSGGFTVIDAYDTNANAYVDAGEPLDDNGLVATIAIQNQIDQDPAMMGIQGNTAGEVSVSRCQITGVVDCAPPGAKNANALVVSPRNSDGSPAATMSPGAGSGTATKRVYVVVTESATGMQAPGN